METGRPTTLAFDGMVATSHYLATAAGLDVLREGGTAADAVIAANAVLTVVYPDQTSIGGDCFLLYHEAASGKLHALNGSGRTPRAASPEAIRAAGFKRMPVRGIHAVTVPGTIDAWSQTAARFGRYGLDRLLRPAIGYARDGFPVSPRLARGIAAGAGLLEMDPYAASIYLPDGAPPSAGDRLVLSDLAQSLSQIADGGRQVFYDGKIAERIVAASDRLGGAFAGDDLADHRGEWVDPIRTDYRGVTVAGMPPNSQGMTALLGLNLASLVSLGEWGTADHLHPLIEAKKRAFAVRDARLSDPAFAEIDTETLLSPEFARDQWADYDPDTATDGGTSREGDTVYLCAVDRDGNAASIIQSIYMGFGSGVVVPGMGIVLQNRGAYFRLADGHPNSFAGGKRTLHTLMPGMLYRDGALWGPIGAQGGDAQAQVHLQLVTDLVDYGMEPQAAIEAPRWVAGGGTSDPATLVTLETGFPDATRHDLAAKGHTVRVVERFNRDMGHAQMILRDPASGLLQGGADPRADGAALGF